MSRLSTILFGIIAGILAFFAWQFLFDEKDDIARFEVAKDPMRRDVSRVGMNLGKWTPWGASQYASNVLFNPGFEAGISRSIVVVDELDQAIISQNDSPNAYLNHFWEGAQFEVLTGKALGQKGVVKENTRGTLGMTYQLNPHPVALAKGDAFVLTKEEKGETPINWWVPDAIKGQVTVDSEQARPNSPGSQSALLILNGKENPTLSSYLDTLGEKAGKMLPVNGPWQLSFWAKGNGTLKVLFSRVENSPFIQEEIKLNAEWNEYNFNFTGHDSNTSSNPLILKFEGVGQEGKIWLDDVSLFALENREQPFRKEVVSALKELRPSTLRNWQGQLGDPFKNSIKTNFGRKPNRYKMAFGDLEYDYLYGLEDFLNLCKEVETNPWIIIPPAYTTEELKAFANFLKSKAGFTKVYLEFGNELWNPLYESGEMTEKQKGLERAQYAFNLIRGTFKEFIPVVSGSYEEPYKNSLEVTTAISTFFLNRLDQNASDQTILRGLFKPYDRNLNDWVKHQKVAIAETNLHTLSGTASAEEKNRVVASAAAGLGLANHLLQAIEEGVDLSLVFKLSGFDFVTTRKTQGFKESEIRLFGVFRDLGSTQRLRPQGLVISAMNPAINGDFYPLNSLNLPASILNPKIRGGAFIKDKQLSIILSSNRSDPTPLMIKLPNDVNPPTKMVTLKYRSIFDSNENQQDVTLHEEFFQKPKKGGIQVTIPSYGLVILSNSPYAFADRRKPAAP